MRIKGLSHTRRTLDGYFELLEEIISDYSPEAIHVAVDRSWEPERILHACVPDLDKALKAGLHLLEPVLDYWERRISTVISELNALAGFRQKPLIAYYEGGIAPLEGLDFVKRSLLYADTVIIEDTIGVLALALRHAEPYIASRRPKEIGILSILSALEALRLKKLCIEIGDISGLPPLIILPGATLSMRKEEYAAFNDLLNKYTLHISSEIFDREFKSFDELDSFISSHKGPWDLARRARVKHFLEYPDAHLNAEKYLCELMSWAPGFPYELLSQKLLTLDYLKRVIMRLLREFDVFGKQRALKDAYLTCVRGALRRVGTQLWSSGRIRAGPITDLERHWRYLLWMCEHDQALFKKELDFDAKILRLIHMPEFKWLGNVDIKDLIRLRKQEALEELRATLRRAFSYAKYASPDELDEVIFDCRQELEKILNTHQKRLHSLRRDFCLGVSSIAIGILSIFCPLLAPVTYILGRLSVIGVVRAFRSGREWWKERERPIGILLKARCWGRSSA